jgi:hypothetical protein
MSKSPKSVVAPRWNVVVTEPGGLSHAWDQTFLTEKQAETAARAWASEEEGRDFLVSLHESPEERADRIRRWDDMMEAYAFESELRRC